MSRLLQNRRSILVSSLLLGIMPWLLSSCFLPWPLSSLSLGPSSSSGKGYPARVLGSISYSPDGRMLVVGYEGESGGEVEVWNTGNLEQKPRILPTYARDASALAFS